MDKTNIIKSIDKALQSKKISEEARQKLEAKKNALLKDKHIKK